MEWWATLAIIFAGLLILFASGLPVAFSFMVINFLGLYLWVGVVDSLYTPIYSALGMLTSYSMLPVPLFLLMGAVLFESGVGRLALDCIDKWFGAFPGRLGVVTIFSGALFGALCGSAIAAVALFGSVLLPEMRQRGYNNVMSCGCVMAAGSLAVIIPPSIFAIIVGTVAQISIVGLLIACALPGIIGAAIFVTYFVIRALMNPDLAPPYEGARISLREKVVATLYISPLVFIVFLVTGLIFLGVATPTEAAALGALGAIVLTAAYGRLSSEVLKKSFLGTVRVTVMVMILSGASVGFSQFLAITGASGGLVRFATELSLPPIAMFIAMMAVVFIFGLFIDQFSETMICVPVFMPIVKSLGWDPVWFYTAFLINLTVGTLTPPFGMLLFTLKGVAPECSMAEIYRSSIPYVILSLLLVALIYVFPPLALWLPGVTK